MHTEISILMTVPGLECVKHLVCTVQPSFLPLTVDKQIRPVMLQAKDTRARVFDYFRILLSQSCHANRPITQSVLVNHFTGR